MWQDGIIGKVMAVLLFICITIIILTILSMIEWAISPANYTQGNVVSKTYIKEWTEHKLVLVGKLILPQTIHHPARYNVLVITNNLGRVVATATPSVGEKLGYKTRIKYVVGIFTGTYYTIECIS